MKKSSYMLFTISLACIVFFVAKSWAQDPTDPFSWLKPVAPQATAADLNYAFQLGVNSYNEGNLKNAAIQFENIVKYQPDNISALSYLGLIYYNVGSYEASINSFKEILKLDPNKTDVYFNLGLSYLRKEDYKNALQSFETAKKIYGDNPDILFNSAIAYFRSGKLDETINNLKKLTEINPNYSIDSYYTLALAYYYKGMADEAASQFNNVVKMTPDDTNWNKTAREYIAKIEGLKIQKPQELSFSIYSNYEKDTNVAYAAAPAAADADTKMTLFASLGYKPLMNNNQPFKLGYSYYALQYATHPTQNFSGHMIEVSYNVPLANSLLALKTNYNSYSLGGSPYLVNIPVDCRYTVKILPWQGAWSILYGTYAIDTYSQSTYKKQNAASLAIGIKQFIYDNLSAGFETKTSRAAGDTTGGSFTDDYSYTSSQLNFNYTQILAFDMYLSLDGSFTGKFYLKEDSSTISSSPTKRTDRIVSISAQISKTIIYDIGILCKIGLTSDTSNLTSSQSALGYGSYSSTTASIGMTKTF